MKTFVKLLWLIALVPSASFAEKRLTFGRYNSRAIFNPSDDANCPSPLVILVPGSGAHGPEEMMPKSVTADEKDHSIFNAFSDGLRRGHVGTLSIGKPGVDFFSSWDKSKWFYNGPLYQNMGWQDLINNLNDAVAFGKTLPCVDPNRIVVLGHSEGTQVAIDFAKQFPLAVKGLILVGFSGESLATTTDWQLFRRPIDTWLRPDVDQNHDGFISQEEAKTWPEFQWDWKQNQTRVSFSEIEQSLRSRPSLQQEQEQLSHLKVWSGVYNRIPLYSKAASLKEDISCFTGTLDVQTRPEEAIKLREACAAKGKQNCKVYLVPGMGHAMSSPKGPRKQKFLDSTLGPVDENFLKLLSSTAAKF